MSLGKKVAEIICNFAISYYYIFVILLYFCTFIKTGFSVGVYSAGLMILIGLLVVLQRKDSRDIRIIDGFVMCYILYCCMTVYFYIANDISLVVFMKAVSNSMLPILFYWVAKQGNHSFYNGFWWANFVNCAVGIVLLYVMPSWYLQYCIKYGYSFTRLSSSVGSTAVGCMCAVAVLISLQRLHCTEGKKGKIQYLISLGFAFASMQRSAWIVVFATLVVAHVYIFAVWKSMPLKYLFIEIIGLSGVFLAVRKPVFGLIIRWIEEHEVAGDTGMFSSRIGQWVAALESSNLLWGNGYGMVGHKAIGHVDNIVADGSWVCLLSEIGIVGVTIFVIILVSVIVIGIRNIKDLFLPLGIVVCIGMQAIGSNMFEYQLIMPVFWYAIGHLASYHKKKEDVENESVGNVSSTVS